MRKIVLLILTICVLGACNESPETKFSKDGVSLTCPEGWIMEENIEDSDIVLGIHPEGFSSSGSFNLTWEYGRIELNEYMSFVKEALSNNDVFKNSNLTIGEQFEHKFNNIDCLALKYTFSMDGIEAEGFIYVFYKEKKTFKILTQYMIQHRTQSKTAFELIEKSFTVSALSETKFSKDGVSLTCPEGWIITEEENIEDDRGYYVRIENMSTDGATFFLVWLYERIDLNEYMNFSKEKLINHDDFKNSNLTFGEQFEHKFNNIDCLALKYTFSMDGIEAEGTIYIFYKGKKTFKIAKFDVIEDSVQNKRGFELIEKSLSIE